MTTAVSIDGNQVLMLVTCELWHLLWSGIHLLYVMFIILCLTITPVSSSISTCIIICFNMIEMMLTWSRVFNIIFIFYTIFLVVIGVSGLNSSTRCYL